MRELRAASKGLRLSQPYFLLSQMLDSSSYYWFNQYQSLYKREHHNTAFTSANPQSAASPYF